MDPWNAKISYNPVYLFPFAGTAGPMDGWMDEWMGRLIGAYLLLFKMSRFEIKHLGS
jgi:hypothetical protein